MSRLNEICREFDDRVKAVGLVTARHEIAYALSEAEKALESKERVIKDLLEYRKNNTLNFQLEKLDDYLRELE